MKLNRLFILTFIALFEGATATCEAQDNEALGKQAREIIKATCHRCHGHDGTVEGGMNYILDLKTLVTRRKVIPGNPADSPFLQRIRSGDMPPENDQPRPSETEIALLERWIQAGAPNPDPVLQPRAFIKTPNLIQAIKGDLDAIDERDRLFTRYFTITHLYNAGISEDELQTYRNGLSKLVNSLSWGRKIVVPEPIDQAKTIFRIDLRDFKWTEKVWETIVAAYPYGVIHESPSATFCYAATGTKIPFIRADWFVATASRPPLYHLVLELPSTDRELEKQLRVNPEANIRAERVARAGFNGSGVSRNNRMIERHESSYGAYWKSYDFGSNTGRKNLFAFPLGPGEDSKSFKHDGGEIIFNLPNGLQAYLLVDENGNRIDRGPTAIVSDAKRPDKAVENGISCMSCHVKGMIEKDDQLREHVQKNSAGFSKREADAILALYPSKEVLAALIKDDSVRFKKAVQETGDNAGTTESIVALTLRFEAELDLSLAAAEVGLTPDELKKGIQRSPELTRIFGVLNVDGGTMQRDVFVAEFGQIVRRLSLGTFATRSAHDLEAPDLDTEFPTIFNGQDLSGWQGHVTMKERVNLGKSKRNMSALQQERNKIASEHWKVENGELFCDGQGGINLQTTKDYGDFELFLDWKIEPGSDSGVYLRGQPQVQIWDANTPLNAARNDNLAGSGGLYNNPEGDTAKSPLAKADNRTGEWNTFHIVMVGNKVTVNLNGETVVHQGTLPNYWDSGKPLPKKGPIELQPHSGKVWFRNIRIKELK